MFPSWGSSSPTYPLHGAAQGNLAQQLIQPLHKPLLHFSMLWSPEEIVGLVRISGQIVQFPLLRILRVPLDELVRFGAHTTVGLHILPSRIFVIVVEPVLAPRGGARPINLQQTATLHCSRSVYAAQ